MAKECGINEQTFGDIEPILTKAMVYIDEQEFDKTANIVGNSELHIRNVLMN